MKKFIVCLCMGLLLCSPLLLHSQLKSPPPRRDISMDVAIENFKDSIAQNDCGGSRVHFSFDIRNKFSTNARCLVTIKINFIDVTSDFILISPTPCETNILCFSIPPNQTKRVTVYAEVQNQWIGVLPLTISAMPYNNTWDIHYYETQNNLNDNTLNRFENLTDVLTDENSFCTCAVPGNRLIDTTALYVIQGYVRKSLGPNVATTAHVAIPFNLRPSLTISDAARFKFRFAGNYNNNPNMPMYTIEFAGAGLFVTREGLTLTFRTADGSNSQKWIIQQNGNGGYGIFGIKEPGRPCRAWGTRENTPPLPNASVSYTNQYDPSNIYQHFNLVKLQ